jgi:hypothetical protein
MIEEGMKCILTKFEVNPFSRKKVITQNVEFFMKFARENERKIR